MKKIAIDISCITKPHNGISRYAENIVTEMIKNEKYFFFLFSDKKNKFFKEKKNVKIHCSNFNFKGSKFFWQQLLLPFFLLRHKINILFVPNHRVPIFTPKKLKIYSTVHDLVAFRFPNTMKFLGMILDRLLLPIAIKKSEKIMCVSKFTKKELVSFFPKYKDKYEISYPGSNLKEKISIDLANDNKKKMPKSKKNFFIYVGTVEPRKNIKNLIYAYNYLLKKKLIDLNFLIIGNKGWGSVDVNKIINNLNLNKHIHWKKNVNDKSLVLFYLNCEFLVLPSIYEGFGLPVLEALKFNKKVLISRNSPMQEIFCNYGVSIDPHSVDSISNGLLKISKKKFKNRKLVLAKHLSQFSWTKCTKNYFRLLEN
jgi:glycosyltransferase involved in cell wall biosynthesis